MKELFELIEKLGNEAVDIIEREKIAYMENLQNIPDAYKGEYLKAYQELINEGLKKRDSEKIEECTARLKELAKIAQKQNADATD